MTLPSVLFRRPSDGGADETPCAPDCFVDLNLDQIVAAITAGKEEYDLEPFFHRPLRDLDDIAFRQEIMRDLEDPRLLDAIKAFAASMRAMREHLGRAEELRYGRQKQRWFLDAVSIYCDAVSRLANDPSDARPASRGLSAFRDHVARYVGSDGFLALHAQTKDLTAQLSAIHYTVLIDGAQVQVRRYDGERDYGAEVEETFAKFQQGEVKDYAFSFNESAQMNHVEAAILEQVSKLYPEVFSKLETYAAENRNFRDPTIVRFDREVQFYVAYLDYLAPFEKAGLAFGYPRVTRARTDVYSRQGFDLALAGRLLREHAVPVRNDFHLGGRERMIVVSGPNQGGKTTFARTFGQLHYLASLGCPVPGEESRLFLFDKILTHFESEEDIADLHGKLEDDLVRIRAILERATPRSIVILNEIFTSTTFRDASALSRKVAARIMELDLLCVWVTFVEELAALSERTVSMVSLVAPENPAQRTYKVVRRPADGLAYALSIAENHRLTHAKLAERLEP